MRVLVVDDKEENLYYLKALLEGNGCAVVAARHGAEALVLARQAPPDLVVSDLLMPVMDGYSLLRHWKGDARLKTIPFVVYTATYTEPEDERLALSLGADAFILKPAEPDDFMARVREVQSNAAAGRPARPRHPIGDEKGLLQSYSETLIRKLEEKTLQLEETNRAILASQERFARVFHSGLVAIAIAEPASGRLVDVNERYAELFGYERQEMIGRTPTELGVVAEVLEPADLPPPPTPPGDSARRREVSLRRRSGEIRYALAATESMTLAEPLSMTVLVDVTARKQLEAQLLQAQKMEAVGRLAGGIAHDFNNALGVIMGYTEILMRRADPADRGKLEQIFKATNRASGLTRQLLAFSRKQVVDPKVLDLNALVADLEPMLVRLIGEDIELTIVPSADLGQVRADPGQIEQVVVNLCVNARDAMPDGGALRIETSNFDRDCDGPLSHGPLVPGRYVMLAVRDSGCGIDEELLPRIFEPFFTTKEPGKGTGLGLAMVYGVAKQAGGHVWVESEVSRGATFKVCLPRVDEPVTTAAAVEATPERGSETVLLVEDEDSLRIIACEVLEEHGYHVIVAASPKEAIDAARQRAEAIDLLITDVVMPGMNGRALAEAVRAFRPALRVLYMSGYTDDVIAHRGVLEPGTLLVEKPFTTTALLRGIRQALSPAPPPMPAERGSA